ncbi:MAG: hypothetical protein ABS939_00435 [Psychrobacillus sp.]
MKTIQLIGTRNKSDFTLFLGYLLTKLDKRVLVVDTTQQEVYKNAYSRLNEGQNLYDFHDIDILSGATNWLEVEELLREVGESSTSYDTIIVDMDLVSIVSNEWPPFEERYYIGDNDRFNQMRDVDLLHRLFDVTDSTEMKRVTFKTSYRLTTDYFDNLMNNRVTWRSMNYVVEPDEFGLGLRIQMGHEQMIPYGKVNKQYKEILQEIVSEIYQLHIKEVQSAGKTSFFKFNKSTEKVKKEKRELAVANSNS